MAIGKKRSKPKLLVLKKATLDSIRDGRVQVRPNNNKNGLSEELKHELFYRSVLHVPTEIDYLLTQAIESMGFDQNSVRVAFYEGHEELRFEIFPPEGV